MATIRTPSEQEILSDAQSWLGSSYIWIGALKVEETNDFYWYTNKDGAMVKLETMPVKYWGKGKPYNVKRKNICVWMWKGTWHDYSCTDANPAFCEYRC